MPSWGNTVSAQLVVASHIHIHRGHMPNLPGLIPNPSISHGQNSLQED